jgi:hypothetical protein
MNLQLRRDAYRADGIFSTVVGENGPVCVGLEHAYLVDGVWTPKIYPGVFTCQRGLHRLHGMTEDFETFEITGVEDHKNLLFHWGNYNENSEGCVLVGESVVEARGHGMAHVEMVTNSRLTFAKFMQLQLGVERFLLTVEG